MKNKKIIKIVISILIVAFVVLLIFSNVLIGFKTSVNKFFMPVQIKIYKWADSIQNATKVIFSYKDVLKENEKLKEENSKLLLMKSENKIILEENTRLLDILEMKKNNKYEKSVKTARVSFADIRNLSNEFVIDLGSNDGIEKDMIVTNKDYLIGKISTIYPEYSLVEMITNPKTMVSVRSSSGILGMVKGNEEEDGFMYFQASTFEDDIKVGEELITSGISDIYPEGIKVGIIKEVSKDKNYLFKSIKVKPYFNISNLREVLVFKYDTKGIK